MKTEHEGLPVKGYQSQSQSNVDLANEGKVLEERTLRWLEMIAERDQGIGNDHDPRCLALGKTNIQQGFMWAIRSIFQPGRITLPEDEVEPNLPGTEQP